MILDDYTQRIKRRSRSTAQQYGGERTLLYIGINMNALTLLQ